MQIAFGVLFWWDVLVNTVKALQQENICHGKPRYEGLNIVGVGGKYACIVSAYRVITTKLEICIARLKSATIKSSSIAAARNVRGYREDATPSW